MNILEERFKLIMAGRATELTSKEILIRHVAFAAERRGQDPMVAVESELQGVTIVRSRAARVTTGASSQPLEHAKIQPANPTEAAAAVTIDSAPVRATQRMPVSSSIASSQQPLIESRWASSSETAYKGLLIYVIIVAVLAFGLLGPAGILPFSMLCLFSSFYPPFLRTWKEIGEGLGTYAMQIGPIILGAIGLFTVIRWISSF